MTAATISYPPITDPKVIAEWLTYERQNNRANNVYMSSLSWPTCRYCARMSPTDHGVRQHERRCRYAPSGGTS